MHQPAYSNELHQVIKKYITAAKKACALLSTVYSGPETFLRAKVLKLIPKEGLIEGVKYYFHGSGCSFEFPNADVNLDFGPDNRCDGFDLFRLKQFFSSIPDHEAYKTLSKTEDFEVQFQELKDAGIIHNPGFPPSTHLYYFTKVFQS